MGKLDVLGFSNILPRDVFTGATGAIWVAPNFSDSLTLFQPGGGFMSTLGMVAPEICYGCVPVARFSIKNA